MYAVARRLMHERADDAVLTAGAGWVLDHLAERVAEAVADEKRDGERLGVLEREIAKHDCGLLVAGEGHVRNTATCLREGSACTLCMYHELASEVFVERAAFEQARMDLAALTKEHAELQAEAEVERLRFAARGGTAKRDTADLLTFMADRMVSEHGEDEAMDWIRAAYERARMLRSALAQEKD